MDYALKFYLRHLFLPLCLKDVPLYAFFYQWCNLAIYIDSLIHHLSIHQVWDTIVFLIHSFPDKNNNSSPLAYDVL